MGAGVLSSVFVGSEVAACSVVKVGKATRDGAQTRRLNSQLGPTMHFVSARQLPPCQSTLGHPALLAVPTPPPFSVLLLAQRKAGTAAIAQATCRMSSRSWESGAYREPPVLYMWLGVRYLPRAVQLCMGFLYCTCGCVVHGPATAHREDDPSWIVYSRSRASFTLQPNHRFASPRRQDAAGPWRFVPRRCHTLTIAPTL